MRVRARRIVRAGFVVLLLALALHQILRGPLIWQADTHLSCRESDNYLTVWRLWAAGQAETSWTTLVNYPLGNATGGSAVDYLPSSPGFWITLGASDVRAFNTSQLVTYLLAVLCMYGLVVYLTGSPAAGGICGLAYANLPYARAMSSYHLQLAHVELLPLGLLALVLFLRRPRWYTAGGIVLAQGLCFWVEPHYGVFFFLIICLFVTLCMFNPQLRGWRLPTLRGTAQAMTLITLCALLGVPQLLGAGPDAGEVALGKPGEQLYSYGAQTWNYFVPPSVHPLLGGLAQSLGESDQDASYTHERTLYLGITLLVLATLGFLRMWRSRSSEQRFLAVFLSTLAVAAFLCSMPPTVHAFGLRLPMPGLLLHKVLPLFRVYARFGLVVAVASVLLAGFGLAWLLSRVHARRRVGTFVLLLVLFEFLALPQTIDLTRPPAVYSWLAEQGDIRAIAEYPLAWPPTKTDDHLNVWDLYEYMLWQRVHLKPMFNGEPAAGLDLALKVQLRDPSEQSTLVRLGWLGITHVIVHKDVIDESTRLLMAATADLELVYEDEVAAVFRIVGTSIRLDATALSVPVWVARVQVDRQTDMLVLNGPVPDDLLLIYGPYIALNEGDYRVRYELAPKDGSGQAALLSVVADEGRATLAEERVLLGESGRVQCEFHTEGASHVEFRVAAPPGSYLFGGVILERLSQ